jgi:hypothetical protein
VNSTLDFHLVEPDAKVENRIMFCLQALFDGFDFGIGRMAGDSLFPDFTIPFICYAVR